MHTQEPNLSIDDEEEEDPFETSDLWERQHMKLRKKNQAVINQFLGKKKRTSVSGFLAKYYGKLLTWALHQYLERNHWEVLSTVGYICSEPIYTEVDTGSCIVNLLENGHLLVEKDTTRYVITVDVNPMRRGSIKIEGLAEDQEDMNQFVAGVSSIADKENFYQGRKLEFSGILRFLDVKDRTWESIALDEEISKDIRFNTLGFLRRCNEWTEYGIPLKRGVLLASEPGMGKTIICRAIMTEAGGITCITTNSYAIDLDNFFYEIYDIAQDLSPSIVFIEDIDIIGQERAEYGYSHGSALFSLLSVMDGVEEKKEIVTVATTNCVEKLDLALKQRPARFDRVIRLPFPSACQRRELIRRLSEKIPLNDDIQEYLTIKTENFTPAQIQEIVFSLVINGQRNEGNPAFTKTDIDQSISRLNNKKGCHMGFTIQNNH